MILEGSAGYDNGLVNINLNLIDTVSEELVWSKVYQQDVGKLLDIRSDIAMNVTSAMLMTLTAEELVAVQLKPTNSVDAYLQMLNFNHVLSSYRPGNPEAASQMLNFVEQAIALDPNYAEPHGHRTMLTFDLAESFDNEVEAQVMGYADQCLAADFSDPNCRRALGEIAISKSNWTEARVHFEHSVKNADNLPASVRPYLSQVLLLDDEVDEALSHSYNNIQVNPVSLLALDRHRSLLLATGFQNELLNTSARLVELAPDNANWYYQHALAQLLSGNLAQALDVMQHGDQLTDEQSAFRVYLYSKLVSSDQTQALIASFRESVGEDAINQQDELYLALADGDSEVIYQKLTALIQPKVASLDQLAAWKYAPTYEPLLDKDVITELYNKIGL